MGQSLRLILLEVAGHVTTSIVRKVTAQSNPVSCARLGRGNQQRIYQIAGRAHLVPTRVVLARRLAHCATPACTIVYLQQLSVHRGALHIQILLLAPSTPRIACVTSAIRDAFLLTQVSYRPLRPTWPPSPAKMPQMALSTAQPHCAVLTIQMSHT